MCVTSSWIVLILIHSAGDGEDIRLAMTYQKSKKELIFLVDPELLWSVHNYNYDDHTYLKWYNRKQFKPQLEQCPPPFFKLAGQCVSYEPSQRPTTSHVTDELLKLHTSMQDFDAYVKKKLKSYLNSTMSPIFSKGYKFWMRHATGVSHQVMWQID